MSPDPPGMAGDAVIAAREQGRSGEQFAPPIEITGQLHGSIKQVAICTQDLVGGQPDRDKQPAFPNLPERFTANPPGLLKALDEAVQTAAPDGVHFAVQRLQLRGSAGEVVATDGRQLLVQGGFEFPWTEDVLVPRLGASPAASWATMVLSRLARRRRTSCCASRFASRRFEYIGGMSFKFYEVTINGCEVVVCFGRIGTASQTQTKSFADSSAADAHAERLIHEKTAKGYQEVSSRRAA